MQLTIPSGLQAANNLSDVADANTSRDNLGILPVSACSVYKTGGTQSITNVTHTAVTFDAAEFDDDGYHFTSAANLTGTSAKTASSTTLTGSSTSYTTELSVGQVISVPGTLAEMRVVTAIASNTSLTVNTAFVHSASGQTVARVNSTLVAPEAGRYRVGGQIEFATAATAWTTANTYSTFAAIWLNSIQAGAGTRLAQSGPFINADTTTPMRVQVPPRIVTLVAWDFIELGAWQSQGASRNVAVGAASTWFQIERVG